MHLTQDELINLAKHLTNAWVRIEDAQMKSNGSTRTHDYIKADAKLDGMCDALQALFGYTSFAYLHAVTQAIRVTRSNFGLLPAFGHDNRHRQLWADAMVLTVVRELEELINVFVPEPQS